MSVSVRCSLTSCSTKLVVSLTVVQNADTFAIHKIFLSSYVYGFVWDAILHGHWQYNSVLGERGRRALYLETRAARSHHSPEVAWGQVGDHQCLEQIVQLHMANDQRFAISLTHCFSLLTCLWLFGNRHRFAFFASKRIVVVRKSNLGKLDSNLQ